MLRRSHPERAQELFELAQEDVDERWRYYSQMAGLQRALPHERNDAPAASEPEET